MGIPLGCGCAFPGSKVASGMGSSPSKFIPKGARGAWEGDLDELWEELGSVPAGSGCCRLHPRCVSVRMRSLGSIHGPPSVLEFLRESPWEPVQTWDVRHLHGRCHGPAGQVIKTSTSGCWHNLFPSSLLFTDSQTPVFLTETRKTLNRVLWEGGAAVGAQLTIGFNFTFGSSRGGFARAGVGAGGAVTEGLAPSCGHGDICSRPCFPGMAGLGKHFHSMVGNKPVGGSFSIPALLSQFSSLTEQNSPCHPKNPNPFFLLLVLLFNSATSRAWESSGNF